MNRIIVAKETSIEMINIAFVSYLFAYVSGSVNISSRF